MTSKLSLEAFLIGVTNGNGNDPREMTVDDLNKIGHVQKPLLRAIRDFCVDCSGWNPRDVVKCTSVLCSLWPYRMGKNVFRESTMTDEQKAAAAARLAIARKAKDEWESCSDSDEVEDEVDDE